MLKKFYSDIYWYSFKSTEEIEAFFYENSDYLQLLDDGNGELELETKFFDRPDRYFLNEDGMYQVGDKVIKAFAEGTIVADVKHK